MFELSCKLIPSTLIVLLIFLLSLHSTWNLNWISIFQTSSNYADYDTDDFHNALTLSQNVTVFACVWFMAFASVSYAYGKASLFVKPFRLTWIHIAIISMSVIFKLLFF